MKKMLENMLDVKAIKKKKGKLYIKTFPKLSHTKWHVANKYLKFEHLSKNDC